jgi:hypothetical protein
VGKEIVTNGDSRITASISPRYDGSKPSIEKVIFDKAMKLNK